MAKVKMRIMGFGQSFHVIIDRTFFLAFLSLELQHCWKKSTGGGWGNKSV
jgi:hypothetical protein